MKSSNIQMHKIDTSNYNDWIDILLNKLIVTAFGILNKTQLWYYLKDIKNWNKQDSSDPLDNNCNRCDWTLFIVFLKKRWLVIKSILFLLLWYPMPYFYKYPLFFGSNLLIFIFFIHIKKIIKWLRFSSQPLVN